MHEPRVYATFGIDSFDIAPSLIFLPHPPPPTSLPVVRTLRWSIYSVESHLLSFQIQLPWHSKKKLQLADKKYSAKQGKKLKLVAKLPFLL